MKDKNVHVQYAVFFLASIPLLSVSFILIPFFFSRDFFSKHDFFIKKKNWVIVFFLVVCHFFVLIGHHFLTRIYE